MLGVFVCSIQSPRASWPAGGLSDPTADVVVRRVRRGLRRIMVSRASPPGAPPHSRRARPIVSTIDTDTAIGTRDRAVILLGYASALRPGEVSALNVKDLVAEPSGVLIHVRRSKTDQDARGQLVDVARGDNRRTDPIRALDAWHQLRTPGPRAHSSPKWSIPVVSPVSASNPER